MLEAHANTRTAPVTQARTAPARHCQTWTEAELDTLRAVARQTCTGQMLCGLVPGRTRKAIKKQLGRIREDLGCARSEGRASNDTKPTMLDPDDEGIDDGEDRAWRRECERANLAYLAAIERAGFDVTNGSLAL